MSKSIKATAVKFSERDHWPEIPNITTNKIESLIDAGMKIYWSLLMFNCSPGRWNELLTLEVHHYFPTDELFESYKNIAYTCIPGWVDQFSPEDLAAYYAANHITVTLEEISDPDLSGFELREDTY